jgi:hypothetical protein
MRDYKPALPHGPISEVFPGVFFVTGTSTPTFMGTAFQFSRNMTVVRDGGALTLINTVRLDDAGLAALEALGKVENVVKIGAYHGIDDAFYVDRYRPKLWALPGMRHESELPTDVELTKDGSMPFAGCSLFVFETATVPEGVLRVDREGGILVSCDSLQNWLGPDEYFSEDSAAKMGAFGFFAPCNVGPGWRRQANPKVEDFTRLLALPFRHLLSAHGVPLRDKAHEELSETMTRLYPT